mmetsp:Transcript_48984/g.156845  ORF Transcript_48984/g.156845 Transcript_48984/m.156845 type:complete len:141 (+) Transcript_48984:326-748(+)
MEFVLLRPLLHRRALQISLTSLNLPRQVPLPELMEGEVIPTLRAELSADRAVSELELNFDGKEGTLEGAFKSNGTRYNFWAFFPDGTVEGQRGFSLSQNGLLPSTIEPFMIDEKRFDAASVAFWITKRLEAQKSPLSKGG